MALHELPPHPIPLPLRWGTAIELRRNGFFPILIVILLLISKNLSRARLRLGLRLRACQCGPAAGLNSMAVLRGGEGGRRSGERWFMAPICAQILEVLRLPVNNELNVFRETAGDFRDDVALEQRNQFVPVRRTEHENVDAQRGGEIENRGGRVFADRVERDDLDAVLPAMIQHGVHDP